VSTTTVTSLQDAILDALSDAIAYRKEEYPYCRDCRNSPVDHCRDHQRDYELARDFEDAERQIRAARFEAGIILLGGTEGSGQS
jgi:hypothetical protein